jgi:hypothetical protein
MGPACLSGPKKKKSQFKKFLCKCGGEFLVFHHFLSAGWAFGWQTHFCLLAKNSLSNAFAW